MLNASQVSVASSCGAPQSFKTRLAFWNVHSGSGVGNELGKEEAEDSSPWRQDTGRTRQWNGRVVGGMFLRKGHWQVS